jgi:hypothetical protein
MNPNDYEEDLPEDERREQEEKLAQRIEQWNAEQNKTPEIEIEGVM